MVHGFSKSCKDNRGFPGGASGKELATQGWKQKLRLGFNLWVGKIP